MANHNLLCTSSNLLMTKPKKGYEAQWKDAEEKARLAVQLFHEVPDEGGVSTYIGRIKEWLRVKGDCFVCFEVAAPESYNKTPIIFYFKVKEQVFVEWYKNHPKEVIKRKEKDISDAVEIRVNKGVILKISWVENPKGFKT